MASGPSRFYTHGGHADKPEPMHYIKLRGVETHVWADQSGNTHLRLYKTDVVSFNGEWITLRTGGYRTKMTKARMNWAAENYNLGFRVDSETVGRGSTHRTILTEGISGEERQVETRDPSARSSSRIGRRRGPGDWYVEFGGKYPFAEDTISLNRQTHELVEKDMIELGGFYADAFYNCKRQRFHNPDGETEEEGVGEDDITTPDHEHWYQYGKLYVTGNDLALAEAMVRDQFFPSVWFISDHGNVIPHDISKAMRIAELKNRSQKKDANPTRRYLPGGGFVERKNPADDIDVEVDDQGGIILFKLFTDAAKEWWPENVSKGEMFGDRYVVEHRYADAVIEAMMADGLNVR